MTLRAPGGLEHYVIEAILIVDPVDVEVLEETGEPTLTLVTCYPFYYVGSAPQRFIIRARPRDASGPPSLAQAGSAIHKEI